MNCYFLRHGIAVEPEEWHGSDEDRPLTREGRTRMEREARAIAEILSEVDIIVTSPLLRARQTAEAVGERLQSDAFVKDDRVAHGFSADAVRAILREREGAESVLFVGHEPTMSAAIGTLIGGADVELKKAALACVELPDAELTGTLTFLIPPKVLVTMGKR